MATKKVTSKKSTTKKKEAVKISTGNRFLDALENAKNKNIAWVKKIVRK